MRHYHTKPLELTIRNVDGGTIWWNRVAMVNANWKFTTARWDHVGTVEKENSKLRAWCEEPISQSNTGNFKVTFGWPPRHVDLYFGTLLYKNGFNSSPGHRIWAKFISLKS